VIDEEDPKIINGDSTLSFLIDKSIYSKAYLKQTTLVDQDSDDSPEKILENWNEMLKEEEELEEEESNLINNCTNILSKEKHQTNSHLDGDYQNIKNDLHLTDTDLDQL